MPISSNKPMGIYMHITRMSVAAMRSGCKTLQCDLLPTKQPGLVHVHFFEELVLSL